MSDTFVSICVSDTHTMSSTTIMPRHIAMRLDTMAMDTLTGMASALEQRMILAAGPAAESAVSKEIGRFLDAHSRLDVTEEDGRLYWILRRLRGSPSSA